VLSRSCGHHSLNKKLIKNIHRLENIKNKLKSMWKTRLVSNYPIIWKYPISQRFWNFSIFIQLIINWYLNSYQTWRVSGIVALRLRSRLWMILILKLLLKKLKNFSKLKLNENKLIYDLMKSNYIIVFRF
jgi:hypothetical protein